MMEELEKGVQTLFFLPLPWPLLPLPPRPPGPILSQSTLRNFSQSAPPFFNGICFIFVTGSHSALSFQLYLHLDPPEEYIEDIQIFGMNMPFISSSEEKNAYFISGEATNEIYFFSLHEMK